MRPALLLAFATALIGAQLKPPPLIEAALAGHPDLHLLDFRIDLKGDITPAEVKELHLAPPWVIADLDRDGEPDVAAAVVKRGTKGTTFGVLAIHAREPEVLHWVVPLAEHILWGVQRYDPIHPDRLTPLYCVYCDGNGWIRWSGNSYEWELYLPGDHVLIEVYIYGSDTEEKLEAHAAPDPASPRLWGIKECTQAVVVTSNGADVSKRWYLVEIGREKRLRGWVTASITNDSCLLYLK